MLTYPKTSLFFSGLLLLCIIFDGLFGLPPITYLVLYLTYSGLFFYGVFSITSNFFIPVACAADTSQPQIAISFDDGPGEYTSEILDILQNHNIKACFFCIGSRLNTNLSLVKKIHQQGHIIGNHSYSHHLLFDLFLSKTMHHDLQRMDTELFAAIGYRPNLFRPPFGVINPALKKAIVTGGYTPVGWSVRSLDTVIKDEQQLLTKVVDSLKPGAIFLFHDTQVVTRNILPLFVKQAMEQGYQFVRVDRLLNLPAYKND